MELPEKVFHFLENQGFVIVSTIDREGRIHCSAKGIVGLDRAGKVFIIDLYMRQTFQNLNKDPRISITAIDEKQFIGYTLQGKARIVSRAQIEDHIVSVWEGRILQRASKRIAVAVQTGVKSKDHFEMKLPKKPKYLIEMDVENIIDLSPPESHKP